MHLAYKPAVQLTLRSCRVRCRYELIFCCSVA